MTNSEEYPKGDYQVPNSCCSQLEDAAKIEACRKDPLNQDPKLVGCWDKFNDELNKNKDNVLIAGVVIVVIMVRKNILQGASKVIFNLFSLSVAVPQHVVCLCNVHHGGKIETTPFILLLISIIF